jgi:protein SCO1
MLEITRRKSLALFGTATLTGWLVGSATAGDSDRPVKAQHNWAQTPSRELIRERYFPNVVLANQEGRKVRLYDDLIKNKIMIINFMYTSCDRICPRVTENLVKVQKLLGDRMGRDIFIHSFTLDPNHDTPKVLKEYAKMHQTGPGWSFLTGTADEMEMLRRRLGFTDPDPVLDRDKENHIGNVRYGNEARELWGACPGMSHPAFIVESLGWVDWPKRSRPAADPGI